MVCSTIVAIGFALASAALACSRPARAPAALGADFCAAAYAGDSRVANDAASEATRTANTSSAPIAPEVTKGNVSSHLAEWLRSLPCVESVEVNGDIIATDPGTQELTFVLRARAGDPRRQCDADLRLAAPWTVGIHPSTYVSTQPDHRCTPIRVD
ncbi:hypothetical protein BH09MYX1_BH09MYX1_60200 [soil metagenome]